MKKNTDPMRMCVACRQLRPKSQLLRIALTKEGPVLDQGGKMDGRGMYVCPDSTCIARLGRAKRKRKGAPSQFPEALLAELADQEVPK